MKTIALGIGGLFGLIAFGVWFIARVGMWLAAFFVGAWLILFLISDHGHRHDRALDHLHARIAAS